MPVFFALSSKHDHEFLQRDAADSLHSRRSTKKFVMQTTATPAQSPFDRVNAAYTDGDFETARILSEAALATDPNNGAMLHLRGLIALALGASHDAQMWLTRAVDAHTHPVYCNSLCVAQTRLRNYAAAADAARRGLRAAEERYPDFPTFVLWYNLGVALHHDEQTEAAAASYREALARNPDHSECHNNLGTVVNEDGNLESGIAHFERAVALDPRNLHAHSNLGHALLAAGRFEESWPHFEHRWASIRCEDPTQRTEAPVLPIPKWSGEPLAADDGLLVLHEQGYGDALQFCRYLPMALERGARVGYVCPAPLKALFEQSLCARWPNLLLLDDEPAVLDGWTRYCSLMSLPMLFGTRVETIPASVPYLFADSRRAQYWAERLDGLGDRALPRIGLVWAGGHTGSSADARRSIAPAKLAPLLSWRGARWISLQKAEDPSKRLLPEYREHVVDWMDEIGDFADTAALIDGLDLVIAVDTSVAHLAAAMGKPVWLLNRFAGCWRWLRDRDDSPWYPGLRLFTQSERGNWDEVLTRVRIALETAGD
jgi:tetratricopeptide (TPR) repeat protein